MAKQVGQSPSERVRRIRAFGDGSGDSSDEEAVSEPQVRFGNARERESVH